MTNTNGVDKTPSSSDLEKILKEAQAGDIVWNDDFSNSDSPAVMLSPQNVSVQSEKSCSPANDLQVKNPVVQQNNNQASHRFIKIDAERIDNILNLVGELVVIKSQIMQDSNLFSNKGQRSNNLLTLLNKTVHELQENSLCLRMTSLKTIFQKLQVATHELSDRLGKKVLLEIVGEDTEIDRGIIDCLADPLLHIVRNSLDHGIELADERKRQGKQEIGSIKITAGRAGGKIFIEVADDGGGIDVAKIYEKALEQNIISAKRTFDSFNTRELLDILFWNGFSTRKESNDISGRGLGLNIVKSNIEQIKGTIEVESVVGVGTTLKLWIPLTTTIIDAMLVQVKNDTYAIPLELIKELVEPHAQHITQGSEGHQYINVRDILLPVMKLDRILNFTSQNSSSKPPNRFAAQEESERNHSVIIVVEENKTQVAIWVDKVIGQSQVVVKNLGAALPASKGVAGAAVLGNGRVGLIIDVGELIADYNKTKINFSKNTETIHE